MIAEADTERALAALRGGELIVLPTETLYGIGCDALNGSAVERLCVAKQRRGEGIAVIVADRPMLAAVSDSIGAPAERLMERFWPGPLTILLPARAAIPSPLIKDGRIGARVSSHPLATLLARRLGRPIAAPSANPRGQQPAEDIAAAKAYFRDTVSVYLDAGVIRGAPSTLVDPGPPLLVLREGAISRAALLG